MDSSEQIYQKHSQKILIIRHRHFRHERRDVSGSKRETGWQYAFRQFGRNLPNLLRAYGPNGVTCIRLSSLSVYEWWNLFPMKISSYWFAFIMVADLNTQTDAQRLMQCGIYSATESWPRLIWIFNGINVELVYHFVHATDGELSAWNARILCEHWSSVLFNRTCGNEKTNGWEKSAEWKLDHLGKVWMAGLRLSDEDGVETEIEKWTNKIGYACGCTS